MTQDSTQSDGTDSQLSTADLASARQAGDSASTQGEPGTTAVETRPSQDQSRQPTPLFSSEETDGFRSHWVDIQSAFVDDPRKAVEQADSLVAESMQRLADLFAQERSTLEEQWAKGDDVSTEDLRVALQRYRSFFDRLLSV